MAQFFGDVLGEGFRTHDNAVGVDLAFQRVTARSIVVPGYIQYVEARGCYDVGGF